MIDVTDYFTLTPKQRSKLRHLLAYQHDARLIRRAYALLWLDDGESASAIAARLQISRQTVYNWASRFLDRCGLNFTERVADADRSGRPCTASGIIDPLIEAVIETDPRELGYRSTIWTAPLLAEYLHDEHLVAVCVNSVRLAIARLRIRWKRPRHCLALRPETWRQAKGGSNVGFLRKNAVSF